MHLKDVMDLSTATAAGEPIPAKRIRRLDRRCCATPTSRTPSRRCGAAASHVARVGRPEGRATGVLFLEDIIEELVGEVQDATSAS